MLLGFKKHFYSLLGALIFFSLSSQGAGMYSGTLLTVNGYLYSVTTEDTPGSNSESKITIYDFKLGYLSSGGYYLGLLTTARDQENGTAEDGRSTGGSFGYVGSRGFFVMGHYIFSAEKAGYREGSGWQGDFGYLTTVSQSMVVGVEVAYRSIDYKKNDANPSLTLRKQSEIFPMLTVGVLF